MKIKNVKVLRARARWHAKEGHVKQGTYGKGKVNGKAEFQGCFVGCLSTPHQESELTKFLRNNLRQAVTGDTALTINAYRTQHARLTRQFGLTPALINVVEALFEAQPTHAEAIDFVPAVARALNEGADIGPDDVRQYWSERFPHGARPSGYGYASLQSDLEVHNSQRAMRRAVREETAAFLKWLRAQKPA